MEGISRMLCRHRRRRHLKERIVKVLGVLGFVGLVLLLYGWSHPKYDVQDTMIHTVETGDTLWEIAYNNVSEEMDIRDYIDVMYEINQDLTPDIKNGQVILLPVFETESCDKEIDIAPKIEYVELNVAEINSSMKRWMDYRKTSNKNSPQYNFINEYGWVDNNGFMRCDGERDLGINDDYYMIALGSYYGTTIGTKYRITTDTGNVFYGVLAECKADIHTNSTHQYTNTKNPDVVEFLVDTKVLRKDVKKMGNANVYTPLSGSIVKIERIEFK